MRRDAVVSFLLNARRSLATFPARVSIAAATSPQQRRRSLLLSTASTATSNMKDCTPDILPSPTTHYLPPPALHNPLRCDGASNTVFYAVFIDAQNVSPSSVSFVMEHELLFSNPTDPLPASSSSSMSSKNTRTMIPSILRVYGHPGLCQQSNWIQTIQQFGFHNPYPTANKQNVDSYIFMDVMETLYTKPHIQTYILVTSDGDFVPLLHKLKEAGKIVYGYGGSHENTSKELMYTCHRYAIIQDLIDQQQQEEERMRKKQQEEERVRNKKREEKRVMALQKLQEQEQQMSTQKETAPPRNDVVSSVFFRHIGNHIRDTGLALSSFLKLSFLKPRLVMNSDKINKKKKEKKNNDSNIVKNDDAQSKIIKQMHQAIQEQSLKQQQQGKSKSTTASQEQQWVHLSKVSQAVEYQSLGYQKFSRFLTSFPDEFHVKTVDRTTFVQSVVKK